MQLAFAVTICGLEELSCHAAAGVTHVLSILDPGWPVPDAFGGFAAHEKLELRFHDIIEPQPGSVMPGPRDIARLLAFGRGLDRQPAAHLLVHCHAGISRSSAALALLMAQAAPATPADAIFAEILQIRPKIWPNLRILELGDAALGRDGALIEAAKTIYRWQLGQRPQLAAEFRAGGRAREVEAAEAGSRDLT